MDRLIQNNVSTDRGDLLNGVRTMLGWLAERPGLPLPVHGAWAMQEAGPTAGEAFHVFVDSEGALDLIAAEFDRVEDAPARHFHRVGISRNFGAVAYEVLVGNRPRGPLTPREGSPSLRSERISGLLAMTDWLGERPALRLPLNGAEALPSSSDEREDDDLVFHVWANSPREKNRLAGLFDRIDKPAYLPAYVRKVRRAFEGGVAYEVRVG